jgi:hypothetical protein
VIYLGDASWHQRAQRLLTPLFAVAVVVSVVHYTDNYVNYSDFPQNGPLPDPSRWLVLAAWFVFTAAGVAGYVLFRRAPSTLALSLLAFYSGSGLVGIGHYTVPGAFGMPAARQAHVIADILLGIAMFVFVIWAARSRAPTPRPG